MQPGELSSGPAVTGAETGWRGRDARKEGRVHTNSRIHFVVQQKLQRTAVSVLTDN